MEKPKWLEERPQWERDLEKANTDFVKTFMTGDQDKRMAMIESLENSLLAPNLKEQQYRQLRKIHTACLKIFDEEEAGPQYTLEKPK